MALEDFHVGQKLTRVITLNQRGNPKVDEITVTKIGRRWVEFEPASMRINRFDAETMRLDGGDFSSAGQVYFSRDEYDQSTALFSEWRDLFARLSYTPPKCLTLADVRELREKLLGDSKQ